MKSTFAFMLLMPLAGAALADGVPSFAVECPGNIMVMADQGGPVMINNKEAETKTINERFFEAKGSGITLSISIGDDDAVTVSYNGAKGAHGMCQSVDD